MAQVKEKTEKSANSKKQETGTAPLERIQDAQQTHTEDPYFPQRLANSPSPDNNVPFNSEALNESRHPKHDMHPLRQKQNNFVHFEAEAPPERRYP